jgi:hypothetical protein
MLSPAAELPGDADLPEGTAITGRGGDVLDALPLLSAALLTPGGLVVGATGQTRHKGGKRNYCIAYVSLAGARTHYR